MITKEISKETIIIKSIDDFPNAEPNYARWVYGLIILHIVLWTLVPTILRHALPMDALEGFVWGQSWQLGYDRDPWLNAWLTHLAINFGGVSGWLVYFLSQLSVGACFWAVWQLGKKILSPVYALIVVFLLEAIQYYSIAAVGFNDNVLQLGLWAVTILYFYNALLTQKRSDWLWTGLFAALSLMAKYYSVLLFLPILGILFFTKEGRVSFKKSGVYFAAVIFLLVVLPHFIWLLFNSGFSTWNYAVMRVTSSSNWHNSWWYFALVQMLAFLGPLFLFSWPLIGRTAKQQIFSVKKKLSNFDLIFLVVLGLGPFIGTVILAALFKMSLHVMWGMPLLSLWGLLLVAIVQPCITRAKFYRFVSMVLIVFFSIITIYVYNIVYAGYKSSATYPGKEVSVYLASKWREYSKSDLNYIVGDRYTAGNAAYFLDRKTKACIWDDKIYNCDDDKVLRQCGAMFVWRSDGKEAKNVSAVLNRIKQKFPEIKVLPDKSFKRAYSDDSSNKWKISIGAAVLQPKNLLTASNINLYQKK